MSMLRSIVEKYHGQKATPKSFRQVMGQLSNTPSLIAVKGTDGTYYFSEDPLGPTAIVNLQEEGFVNAVISYER